MNLLLLISILISSYTVSGDIHQDCSFLNTLLNSNEFHFGQEIKIKIELDKCIYDFDGIKFEINKEELERYTTNAFDDDQEFEINNSIYHKIIMQYKKKASEDNTHCNNDKIFNSYDRNLNNNLKVIKTNKDNLDNYRNIKPCFSIPTLHCKGFSAIKLFKRYKG